MEFSRQEYQSGLPFPSPGALPNPETDPRSSTLQADSLLSEPPVYLRKFAIKGEYKAGGGDGTPSELFQILKDDAVKVLHSICQQIWKSQQGPQDWKWCFHPNLKEKQLQRMLKLPHNCTHLTH